MNGSSILEYYRHTLSSALENNRDRGRQVPPLPINPWLAMSLLQKAIRRGHNDWAQAATATLLETSPDRFWRRINVIAFEDIGVADRNVIGLTVAALHGKRWRRQNGGDAQIAAYLVDVMCEAEKCRAADDLATACEWHPHGESDRLCLTFKPIPELLDHIDGSGSLITKALALWFAIGTNRHGSENLRERRGEPYPVFDALCERGFDNEAVEIAREGYKKGAGILAALHVPLVQAAREQPTEVRADNIPSDELTNEIPCWVLDMHTREGKGALARYRKRHTEFNKWLDDKIDPRRRQHTLYRMLFSVESGLVDRRFSWEKADRLSAMVETEICGIHPDEMREGLRFLRNELPILNEERRHVA